MEQIIKDIINFVNENKTPKSFFNIEEKLGKLELRLISIKLLGWIKSQHRCLKKQPLKLEKKYPWSFDLIRWLDEDKELSTLFVISEGKLDFSNKVTENERETIRAFVNSEYNPPLFT
jgi:hypothetical protein